MNKELSITYVEPSALVNNPWNPNQVGIENEQKIRNSMAEIGDFKPIICRELDDGQLQILGGQHRAQVYESMGEKAPIINLGEVDDVTARKIILADNARYGEDDANILAEIYQVFAEEGVEIEALLPVSEEDISSIMGATSIDLNALTLDDDEDIPSVSMDEPDDISESDVSKRKPIKLKINIDELEFVQDELNKISDVMGLDDIDQSSNRGDVLVYLLKKHALGD